MAESKSPIHHRIFALVLALLFFVTSAGVTIFAVWQAHNNSSSSQTTSQTSGKQLAGTQLQNFTPTAHVSSLAIQDVSVGSGQVAKAGNSVMVDYTGAIAGTGIIFQSSLDSGQPVSITLNSTGAIPGFVQGVIGMKVNGTRRIFIPSALGYGSTPQPGSGIPANADLIFDVTLHSIN